MVRVWNAFIPSTVREVKVWWYLGDRWTSWLYDSNVLAHVVHAGSCINACFCLLQAPRMLVSQYLTKESK